MPLAIPPRASVAQTVRAYLLSSVPEWDTSTSRRSFVGGMVKSIGSALHDWYTALKVFGEKEPFPQTATGDFLYYGWWGDITHLAPNPASPAFGIVVLTGVAGSPIPANTVLTANNLQYFVRDAVSITQQAVKAISLTSVAGIATFVTSAPHNLATGMTVVISGATQSQYNGAFQIIVISDTAFTYAISGTPTSPATGSPIQASAAYANTTVYCGTNGSIGNMDGGATLGTPNLTGVDGSALVTFDGIQNGTDSETREGFRRRILNALGNDLGTFTGADAFGGGGEIQTVMQQIPGTTRVWVRRAVIPIPPATQPPPGYPAEGQVIIFFMRDNDPTPFPSSTQVNQMQAWIAQQIMPANTAIADVIVNSPTPQPINFAFTALNPDTPTMRSAILASLAQFFTEGVNLGANVLQDDYRCAIRDTYDSQTRTRLTSFALSSPIGDQVTGVNSLPILGSVTFP